MHSANAFVYLHPGCTMINRVLGSSLNLSWAGKLNVQDRVPGNLQPASTFETKKIALT